MNKYEPVIGLEVHVELNTKTKMFCRCSAEYFGKAPNTHTCPTCLGLPGALPITNKEAINKCMQIGLALNCSINENSYFERKNYFYPDLPKGFQTSQLVSPLAVNGWIEVEDEQENLSRIRINRVHQEEDTGKLSHQDGKTLIDFNRSGVPLVEIVTEPDFKNSSQVRDYAKKLQQIFRYLGVSNADMERGDMRLEANISVRPVGQKELPPYRIELKNINSFRFMVAAIEYEIKRQSQALDKGEKLVQETRGWNEAKKQTFLQRSKEEAHDYRYFPEPDLPKLVIDGKEVNEIKQEMPELPQEKVERYTKEYGISKQISQIITESKENAQFFEEAVKFAKQKGISIKDLANFFVNQKIDTRITTPDEVVDKITSKKIGVVEDIKEIEKIAKEAIIENPDMVEKYKSGKLAIIQALVGVVMRKTQGKANAGKAKEILEELLK